MASSQSKNKYKFPFDIVPLDKETNDELLKFFPGERDGFVQVGPNKYFFQEKYKHLAEDFYNFEARSSDVWVTSFPRCGTTWTQEMVWLICNDLNFKKAREQRLVRRFPFFEFAVLMHSKLREELLQENQNDPEKMEVIEFMYKPGYEVLQNVPGPRFIKSHFPFSLLPPSVMKEQCKVIYVARHPKDVAVSFYYLNRIFKTRNYLGDFEQYWNYFENGFVTWSPYWSHLKEAWEHRHHQNVLFLFYEDMVNDLRSTILEVANFLGKELSTEDIENLMDHLNIENFRNNPAVNFEEMNDIGMYNQEYGAGFIRKGVATVGWQEEYDEMLKSRVEKWIKDNVEKTGIIFPERHS